MEFHQIRYFLAATDHMNFTRAAEACAVSQPALTVAIQKLEAELGGALFDRDGRGISLTSLGQTMRTHLARIEETRLAAGRIAQAVLDGCASKLDIGVYSTIGPCTLAPAFAAFQAEAPEIEIVLYDIWGQKSFDLLLSGAFDCAVVACHGNVPERIELQELMIEPMVLALPEGHPLAARPVTLSDLAELTYFDRLRCEFRQEIMAKLEALGVTPKTVLRSEPEDWVQHAIAAGRGATIAPRDSIVTPGIVTTTIQDLAVSRTIALATVKDRPLSSGAERFAAYMRDFDWSRKT